MNEEQETPRAAELLTELLETGTDFAGRRIFLMGPIDDNSARAFIASLHLLAATPGEIYVTLNSPGGEEPAGYAIYDAIQFVNRVTIDVYGEAASMAAVVLQAARVRRMGGSSDFMIHNGARGGVISPDNDAIEKVAAEIRQDNRKYYDRLLAGARRTNPKISLRRIRQMCSRETRLSALEAVKLGFADSILSIVGV